MKTREVINPFQGFREEAQASLEKELNGHFISIEEFFIEKFSIEADLETCLARVKERGTEKTLVSRNPSYKIPGLRFKVPNSHSTSNPKSGAKASPSKCSWKKFAEFGNNHVLGFSGAGGALIRGEV